MGTETSPFEHETTLLEMEPETASPSGKVSDRGIASDASPPPLPATDSGERVTSQPAMTPVDTTWGASPASDADLAAIARASGVSVGRPPATAAVPDVQLAPFPDDEEMVTWSPTRDDPVEDARFGSDAETADENEELNGESDGPRRRRRRGRGRRGGAGRSAPAELAQEESAEPITEPGPSAVSPRREQPAREPVLPSYPVEFEPTPPPTKRRPARRPGMMGDPRFSAEEQAEVDQFVRTGPPARASVPVPEQLRASLLTAEEEQALAQAAPARRRSRRGRGGKEAAQAPSELGLHPTPAFEPMPVSPSGRTGQNSLEALLGRQNVILDTLMERQISLLRNIERSLIALDQRLAHSTQGVTSAPRTGIFVDVPNVIYAAERIGCTIDFGKLLSLLTSGRELVRAIAYAPVSDDPQMRLESQKFVQPFVGRGYRIVTKPLKRFADGTMKGNFDVELAMDILTMADRLDVVCLVSGDGDFSRLVEIIAGKGVRVEVVAFSGSTSSELRATCDEYIDLSTRLREICS